jgi:hypothetical protein
MVESGRSATSTMGAAAPLEQLAQPSRELVPSWSPRHVALELLRAICPALPEPVAEVIAELIEEDRLTEAVRRAEAAIAALRRPAAFPLSEQAPPRPRRASECDACPELQLCGGSETGCAWAWCSQRCAGCGVRCPRRADLPAWRTATHSLALDDLVAPLGEPPNLPAVLPVLDLEELRDWRVARYWPAWAVSLTEAHSQRTGAAWRAWLSGAAAGEARAAGAQVLVLTGVASDQLLAAAWPLLSRGRSAAGFDLVVAPAWSIYDDDPRMEHLFAIRQSIQTAVALSARQPVVPTLHWYRSHDLDRQLSWARASRARAVAIDCSTLPGRLRWLEVRAAMAYVRAALPGIQLHVQGPASRDRLQDLARLGATTIYTRRPAALARARRVLDADLRDRPGPDDRAECLLISVENLSRQLGG